jgi:hypothetical protein
MSDQAAVADAPTFDPSPEAAPPPDPGVRYPDGGDAPTGAPGGEGAPRQANTTGDIEAETVSFATIENQIFHLYRSRAALRDFTCADAQPVSESWEEASAWSYGGTGEEVEGLVRHLEEQRVLLLDAARGAGRVMASICLGRRLRDAGSCGKPTLLVQSLDRQVRVDLRRVASRDRELEDRMVIFRDALPRVERTDRSGWQQLREQLRERNAYVVFITESATASPDGLAPTQAFVRPLPRHSRERMEAELEKRLWELGHRCEGGAEVAAALDAGRDWLLEAFAYAPQLAEFVSLYAELNRPGLALEEAWARFRDTGGRLLRDADGDLDAWSGVLALALSQCLRDTRGVRWVDLDRLHRHLRAWLREDLDLRAPRTPEGEEAVPPPPPEFSDEPFLAAAHAEDYVDPATLACMVRFRGGVPPEEVWQALLRRHRRALGTLLPGLRRLAEEDEGLGVLAAQVIGRIGELDPERIVLPVVSRWIAATKGQPQGCAGALFEGVLGSASKPYQALCLDHLRALGRGGGASGGARLPAVIAAYSWIGDFEPGYAMRELGAIAREELAPMVEDVQRIGRLLARVKQKRDEQRSAAARAVLRRCQSVLDELVSRVYAEKASTYVAMQLSLASLIATRGLRPVIGELRRWVAEGGWKMGVLVAMMFLNEKGIAERLKKPGAEAGGCNALVAWIGEGDDEVRLAARFLGDLFESLATPFLVETELQRHCAASLREHLAEWIRDALPVSGNAAAMRSLLETMGRMPVLREPLLDLLEGPELEGDPRLRAFAASIQV